MSRFVSVLAAVLLVAGLAMVFGARGGRVAQAQATGAAADPVGGGAMPPQAFGKQATVHFRRDYLAGEPLLPMSPVQPAIRGIEVAVSGVLRGVDGEWIVLETDRSLAYIPRKAVLVLEVVR
jgi:hypothetical protein